MSRFAYEIKATSRLAAPLVMTALAQMGMEIVDTLMMGMLGPHALASGALGTSTFMIIIIAGIGILSAVGVFTARAYGAKKPQQATRVVQQGLWFALFISIPTFAVLWWMPKLLLLIGEPARVVAGTEAYLHGIAWGLLPLFCFIAMREFSAALTKTTIILLISVSAMPFNAVFNYILMYGKFGLPAMGIGGIGLASALVEWLMFISMTIYLLTNRFMQSFHISRIVLPDLKLLYEQFRLGWPISVFFVFEAGMFSITSILMGFFGANQLAAHQIALQVAIAAFMFPMGISQATAIRVGHHMGAENFIGVRQATQVSLGLGLIIATITAIIFWTLTKYIAGLFLDLNVASNQPAIHLAEQMLHVAAVFQLVDAVQVICNGGLRGLKDTFVPMVLGLVSYWIVGLGSGYLFGFVFGWQGIGLWWGLATGITASALLLLWRLRRTLKAIITAAKSL